MWEEKNYGDFGNLNFITGAGGYLQNYINGYAGLRYTEDGLTLRPVLPPHGCASLALRGIALATSRFTAFYTASEVVFTLSEGTPLEVSLVGGVQPATTLEIGVPKHFPIASPGKTVFSAVPQ